MDLTTLARDILLAMIAKSGVREWDDPAIRESMTLAALEIASNLYAGTTMALPDSFVIENGTAIVFADTTDYSPATATSVGTRTNQIDLTSVANAAARQSEKVDLGGGNAYWAEEWEVTAAFEIAATPTAGNVISLYWAPSISSTAANSNPGNTTGSDAAYSGYSSNISDSVKQLQFIGDFVCTAQATATVQMGRVGSFRPKERYGSLVVFNNSGAALHSDAVEMGVRLEPVQGKVID